MEIFALVLGYVVMVVASGVAFVASLYLVFAWVVEKALSGVNGRDLREAIDEWKTNHPDKWAAMKKRNGQDG